MTWAADHPHRLRWRRSEAVAPSGVRAFVRPLGAAEVGLLSALVGAWGAISVFVGPLFGYTPTSSNSWDWTQQNWLLHLIPGAVAVFAGLIILMASMARGAGRRGSLGLSSLLLIASGAWFVLGPVAWPTFSSGPAFMPGTSDMTNFLNQLGSSLGPGLLLAILGGMAMKAGIARPAVALGEDVAATGAARTAAPAAAAEAPPVRDTSMMAGTGPGTGAAPAGEVAPAPAGTTSGTTTGAAQPRRGWAFWRRRKASV